MNKSDLKYGNVVELRNKAVYLYNLTGVPLLNFNGEEGKDISQYKKDLTFINNTYSELDIMKVYKDFTFKEVLWERKEKPKLTDDEKAILRNINERRVIMTDLENELKISKNELKELIYFNNMYFREDLSEKDEEALSNAIYALFCQIFGLYNKNWARNIIYGITLKNQDEPNETYFKVFETLGCELY